MRALAYTVVLVIAGCGADTITGARPDAARAPDAAARPADAPRSLPDAARLGDAARPRDAAPEDAGDNTPDMLPDGAPPMPDAPPPPPMGGTMRVTATSLNLRQGPGTTNAIVTSMPCGTEVTVLGGPTNGWWNVRFGMMTGWASGAYLAVPAAFDPATCGGTMNPPPPAGTPPEVGDIFARAQLAVGYSYYWGHGSWRDDGAQHGACSGSCPNCTHSGAYGADCSGFVAKAWQIPGPSPITTDAHPYSTHSFFFDTSTHWTRVDRGAAKPADAFVYNSGSSGHIVLFESGADPWGATWIYEARGCATGVVHNLRTVGSSYVAIRRQGL